MEVLYLLDLIGTAVFAYSGALAARGHGYNILGVLYIALLTAVGGGTVRYLLLQTPGLFWFESSGYAWVVIAAVSLSYVLKVRTNSIPFYLLDSFALAVFIAIAFNAAISQGFSTPVAIGVGTITGIGGGLIRDAITSQQPQALSDPVYPGLIFSGCAGCILGLLTGYPMWPLSIAFVLTVAATSIVMRERLPAVVAKPPDALIASSFANASSEKKHRGESIPRAIAKAATVLIMVLAIGFYFLSPSSNQAIAMKSTANKLPLVTASSADRLFNKYVANAQTQLEKNDLTGATQSIKNATLLKPQHPLIDRLDEERALLDSYLQHIAVAETAYDADDFQAMQYSLSQAAVYDRRDHRYTNLLTALSARLNQIDIDKKQQAIAESGTEFHITSARYYLQMGNTEAAGRELTKAESYGLQKTLIANLRAELSSKVKQESSNATPALNIPKDKLSPQELQYAEAQFSQLQKAIELRNLAALKILTTKNNEKYNLFDQLFNRYVQFDVHLTELTNQKKNVSVQLELERMRLPSGNYTYPSSEYGVIALSLKLTDEGWTKIQW